jgi:hypothetical protein
MSKFETYISVDGVTTKQTSVEVVVDVDAEIASKEEELLKVYAELEEMKAAAQE